MSTTHVASPGVTRTPEAKRHLTLLFIGLMVTMLLASLNQTVLSTALPTIVGELNGMNHMTWVITGYILASTVVMPIYGRVSDIVGRKPALLTAITLFIIGSIVGGLAPNIEVLIAARVIQGLGGGGLIILSQAAIADVVPARERGKYMGIMGSSFAVASVAGPLLGGWLTEGPGWRWAFWMSVPLGLVAIATTVAFLKLPPRRAQSRVKIDYLGMALLSAATTTLVLVCTWGGGTYAWDSVQVLSLIGATVVLSILFVWAQSRAAAPVIPLALFRDRNFNAATLAALMIGVAMFGAIGYMPTYIQMVTGVSATTAGLLMVPMMGCLLVSSIVSGQVVSRTGQYKAFPLAGAAVMGAGLYLMSILEVDSPTWAMCAAMAVFGVGIGLGMQIIVLIVQNSFPNSMVGTATAATNYFRQVGATVGSAIVGSVFATRLTTGLHDHLDGLGDAAAATGDSSNSFTPALVNSLPDAIRVPVIESYNEALLPIFAFMIPLAVVAFISLLFVKQTELATTVDDAVEADAEDGAIVAAELGAGEPVHAGVTRERE
ncbi:MDR family MFS transporter [Demequina globuliformis]|uniref:MDR family MFS transporter n=1 Tax=Demequina globuliformis TaxID=676202 RepID=UPI000781FBC3|nr:MDR family MFS transporter [Demequina globuliformis]